VALGQLFFRTQRGASGVFGRNPQKRVESRIVSLDSAQKCPVNSTGEILRFAKSA